ncbi:helix-turn-helix domain-containing protein [Spongiibacter sp. KMU-158]|uniref:Helix-turn-helix domain-containing protein n=1 Tax=Spongiibacter pelagi TaxID=2760804 RepID=A0A927GX50_9GAMM|nr:AraC family transcriptional regulator [Spongiibacter pelagi]MBD2860150.1 helix-turn-helix domain-containing protein [Spongiibacter pelagi]
MNTKSSGSGHNKNNAAGNLQLTDISSNHLTLLSWVLQRHGMDAGTIFAEANVSAPATNSPTDRVPLVSVIRVLEHIREKTGDPCIGLKLYRYMRLTHLNVLGFALSCSSTLLDFVLRAQRFFGYVGSAFRLEIEELENSFLLRIQMDGAIFQEQLKGEQGTHLLIESFGYSAFGITQEVYGDPVPLLKMYLYGEPHPDVVAEFKTVGGEAPVITGNDFLGVEVDKVVMKTILPGANPQLARESDELVIELMATISQTNIVHRCERLIMEGLATGDSSLKQVARQMGMSERVLQQHLHDDGLSFSSLVNRIKKTLAIQYLQEDKKNISQIAYMLGFDSASNFSRAFRSWTGFSPREFKNQK